MRATRLVSRVPIALVVLAFARASEAQSPPAAPTTLAVGDFQLAPTLEVRTRAEYSHSPVALGGTSSAGASTPVVDDAWSIAERARLGLGAERGPLRAQLTLQDARAWGATSAAATLDAGTGRAALGAFEAFVELHAKPAGGNDESSAGRPSLPRRSFVRVGRQAFTWGDGRLLSEADASPTGRALDAVRARFATEHLDLEALAAFVDLPRPLGTSFGDALGPASSGTELYGARAAWTFLPLARVEAFALARMQGSSAYRIDGSDFALARTAGETYTAALRVSGQGSDARYGVAGYVQTGRAPALGSMRADRLAFAWTADVARTFEGLLGSPTLSVGAAMASGDDRSGSYAAFDPIMPDVYAHHGAMNVFSLSNLMTASGGISLEPATDVRVGADYRYARLFTATGEWLDGTLATVGSAARSNRAYELGHEVDVFTAWHALPQLDVRAGYSLLALGDGTRAVLSAQGRGERSADGSVVARDFSHFAYCVLTARVP